MADRGRSGELGCNESCGCPNPCLGGASCRCSTTTAGRGKAEHSRCPCGSHCGCNPCACEKVETAGRNVCRCGPGCACEKCST